MKIVGVKCTYVVRMPDASKKRGDCSRKNVDCRYHHQPGYAEGG